MMYLPEFKHRCGIKLDGNGGNKIALVVAALDDYGSVRDTNNHQARIAGLRLVAKAAAWWLFSKMGKTKESTNSRRKVVEELLDQALTELEEISPEEALYAKRKCAAIKASWLTPKLRREKMLSKDVTAVSFSGKSEDTAPLFKQYAHERTDYIAGRKQRNPLSGSNITYPVENIIKKLGTPHDGVKKYVDKKEIKHWNDLKFQTSLKLREYIMDLKCESREIWSLI